MGGRGREHSRALRRQVLEFVIEALARGARQFKVCEVLGLSERTLQRWRALEGGDDQRQGPNTPPAHSLSPSERVALLKVVNSPEFRDLPPAQIVARLADQGRYIASEATIYRILRHEGMNAHREPSKPRQPRARPAHTATAPRQLWVWDITYLPTLIRGRFYYLYMFEDLFSRKLVGWSVEESESMKHSGRLLEQTCRHEEVVEAGLVVHSDNGSPMKGATMLATMQRLGVASSFSRPGVSNDNAFCEAVFRTLKYRSWYPKKGFESVEQAREWVEKFVEWYNEEHRHSGIKYVTPSQRHRGEDAELLEARARLYERARQQNPGRWKGRRVRNWDRGDSVSLTPVRTQAFMAKDAA